MSRDVSPSVSHPGTLVTEAVNVNGQPETHTAAIRPLVYTSNIAWITRNSSRSFKRMQVSWLPAFMTLMRHFEMTWPQQLTHKAIAAFPFTWMLHLKHGHQALGVCSQEITIPYSGIMTCHSVLPCIILAVLKMLSHQQLSGHHFLYRTM